MIRSRFLSSLFVTVVLNVGLPHLVFAQGAQRAPSEDNTRARDVFRQGLAAMKDGKFADARKAFQEAFSIRRTYDVAASLGQVELELKAYRDAAEHLDFALKNFAPRESAESLENVKTGLQTAKQHVAEIRISVNEPSAQIALDGRDVGVSPLANNIFVEAGQHTVEARLGPDRIASQNVKATEGASLNVELVVRNASGAPTTKAPINSGLPISPADTTRRSDGEYTAPAIAATAGGVALITGVVLLVVAAGDESERSKILDELPGMNACANRTERPSDCARVDELADTALTLRVTSYVTLGAAVVGGALTYLLWPSDKKPLSGFTVRPLVMTEGSSLHFGALGRF